MDSENSMDGEVKDQRDGGISSDEEGCIDDHPDSPQTPPGRPRTPPSPRDEGSRLRSDRRSHSSDSASNGRHTPSPRPRRSPSGSPDSSSHGRQSPPGSPVHPSSARSPEARTPSGSPARGTPTESPNRGTPTSSPPRRSPSSSPAARRPPSPTDSLSRSPTGSRHSDRGSYSRRAHGKKAKQQTDGDGNVSDGSDDGRSSISSSSSFGGPREKSDGHMENGSNGGRGKFEPHKAEDLSDVSDLDSAAGDGGLDSLSDEEGSRKKTSKPDVDEEDEELERKPASPVRITQSSSSRKDIVSQSDEMEQLDFEAEEPQGKEDREDGECAEPGRRPTSSMNDVKSEADEGEVAGEEVEEVEEGEITDEDDNRPEETEPRPICRFYNRGQCTWGSSCRFLHPGVTDKGNYTMFDMVRPLVPANGPPIYPIMDYRPIERPMLAPLYPPARKEEAPVVESAWERGLRTAKEMMRKASKRKETDMDFEEKKMNLSLGQDELDKENDYYTRPASPALDDDLDRWSGDKEVPESKHHRVVVADRYDPVDPYYLHHHERERWAGRGHYDDAARMGYGREHMGYEGRHSSLHDSHMAYRAHVHPSAHEPAYYPDKYERKKKSHTVREVIVQHTRKPWKEERPSAATGHRGRGDEWADPWMRSKSPTSRKARPSRRQSYSSGSSYSSSRSSRSYSSSYSRSASRSRSRSHSKSRSPSASRSRSRSPPPHSLRRPGRSGYKPGSSPHSRQRRPAGDPRVKSSRPASPGLDKRASHMNPPAPSPRNKRPPSPAGRKSGQNPPPPPSGRGLDRKAVSGKSRRSRSSRSSSSDSSGSSSDSSATSMSSSSSSGEPTPPPKPKKIVMDERLLAQSTKVKAMDALKLSGQKQQIKLTLKAPGSAAASGVDDPRRSTVAAGKKRAAESPPPELPKGGAAAKPAPKKTTSRREELLKQLKAVEDAIARKRSKIT